MKLITKYISLIFRDYKKNVNHWSIIFLGIIMGWLSLLLSMNYNFYERSYDKFHKNYSNIYRLIAHSYRNGEIYNKLAIVPYPNGPKLYEVMPEIEQYTRFRIPRGIAGEFLVKHEENVFQEDDIYFADEYFLDIFSFDMIKGDPKSIKEINTVILTEKTAKKYFGNEDPMNKTIKIKNKWGDLLCRVTGVLKDLPSNTHFNFSMLVSVESYMSLDGDRFYNNWGDHSWYVYFVLSPGCDPVKLEEGYRQIIYDNQPAFLHEYDLRYPLQKINDVYFCRDHKWDLPYKGNLQLVKYLTAFGILLFVLSFICVLNLSVIHISKRTKELFIRKCSGASFRQVLEMFFIENIIFLVLSFIVGLLLFYVLISPFGQIIGKTVPVYFYKIKLMWLYLPAFILLTIFIATLYQGIMYFLCYKRKNEKIFGVIRNSLTVFQISFSLVFIIGTIVFYNQFQFITNQELGFNSKNILVFRSPIMNLNETNINRLKSFIKELENKQKFVNPSTSNEIPGKFIEFAEASFIQDFPDNKQLIYWLFTNQNFLKLYGIEKISGEYFKEDFNNNNLILNLKALKTLAPKISPEDAVGKLIMSRGKQYKILGIVKDHHQQYLREDIMPIIYEFSEGKHIDYISVKLTKKDHTEDIMEIKNMYKHYFPDQNFNYFFIKDYFNNQYKSEIRLGIACLLLSIFALILVSLSLVGIINHAILNKFKSIAVRKALGANNIHLYFILSKSLIIQIVIAILISIPCVFYILTSWLNNFAYHTQLTLWQYAIGIIIMLVIVFAMINSYIIKAIHQNVTETLKYE